MILAPVLTILGWSLTLLSALMLIPSIFALGDVSGNVSAAFFASAIVTVFLGGGLIFANRMEATTLDRRETFLTATIIWVVIPIFAALPFYLGNAVSSPLDAYFEAISGFTTNGASVIDNLGEQSRGIILWRALIQWLGGFAIILFVSALASEFGVPGSNPLNQAIAKSTRRRLSRRIRYAVVSILKIYTILTFVCIVLLWLSGMEAFNALCYGFSTLSTGGFTVSNDGLEVFGNRMTETVLIIFMIIGAVNFSLHWAFFNGDRSSYFKNPEYRYFLFILVFCSLIMFFLMKANTDISIVQIIRYSIFNTVSALSTTGYTMAPISENGTYIWPASILLLIMFIMCIGGSTGSTSGGIKLMRVILLLKQGAKEIKRLSFPSAIIPLKYGSVQITRELLLSAWGFFTLFCLAIIVISLGLSFTGLDFRSSLALSISNLASAGSSVSSIMIDLDPNNVNFTTYGALPIAAKVLLCFAMLIGRLEFFAVFTLLNPAFWRR
ncbi:MAG: TrkH family potassium uptake protein [Sneathiella sp.]